MTIISEVDTSGITFKELPRPPYGQHWAFRLSRPVPYTRDSGKGYVHGERMTDVVIVSWGRYGDTLIAPAEWLESVSDELPRWVIADMLGYWCEGCWVDPHEAISSWLAAPSGGEKHA